MLIQQLKLNYFGRFHNRDIQLKPGLNIIYGENEAGKSTLHAFIKGMLFGIERLRGRGAASKEDTYTRYLPWDYPGAYGGSMDLLLEGKEYRLSRSFHANDKSFTITELSSGRELKLKEGLISELLPGLTEATYRNTVSIEQLKASTDQELAAQVRNYIANLSVAKSKEINVAKAVSTLTEQRKQLDTSQSIAFLKELEQRIEEGVRREEKVDQLTLQLRDLLKLEEELTLLRSQQTEKLKQSDHSRMDQLPAITEKYNSYTQLTKQAQALDQQEDKLDLSISSLKMEQLAAEQIREAIRKQEQYRAELMKLEQKELDLQSKWSEPGTGLNPYVASVPIGIAAILVLLLLEPKLLGILFGVVLLGASVLSHRVLYRRRNQRFNHEELELSEVRQSKVHVKMKLEELLEACGVNHPEELMQKQEEFLRNYYSLEHAIKQKVEIVQRKKQIEDQRDLLYEAIMKYMQYFTREEELTQEAMDRLQEEIKRKRNESLSKLEEISKRLEECKFRIEKVRWELETLEDNEGQLLKDREQYQQLKQQIKEQNLEKEAINLALTTIQKLSIDIHDSFGKQLNEAVSEVICEITGNRYQDLKVDEKLDIKLGWKGNYVMLDRLSAGTIDQVYFALRLAVADLLMGKDSLPLFLDDSLAFYDEARVKAALRKLSHRKQVLLFTCHRREEQLLKELGIPYHKVELSS